MQYFYLPVLIFSVILVTACSDNSDSSPKTITGEFIDSKVEGLSYKCSSGDEALTDKLGRFTCKTNDIISFSINSYELGSTTVAELISPKTLYPDDATKSLDLAQLLQTLDSDSYPTNGITLNYESEAVMALNSSVNVHFGDVDFDSAMSSYIGKTLVDETTALAHLNASLGLDTNSTQNIEVANDPLSTREIDTIGDTFNFWDLGDVKTDELYFTISYTGSEFTDVQNYYDSMSKGSMSTEKLYLAEEHGLVEDGVTFAERQGYVSERVKFSGILNYAALQYLMEKKSSIDYSTLDYPLLFIQGDIGQFWISASTNTNNERMISLKIYYNESAALRIRDFIGNKYYELEKEQQLDLAQ